jgi:hypothetical protein
MGLHRIRGFSTLHTGEFSTLLIRKSNRINGTSNELEVTNCGMMLNTVDRGNNSDYDRKFLERGDFQRVTRLACGADFGTDR